VRADVVAVEVLDDEATAVELRADEMGDRRLARPGEPREPEGEAALADAVRLRVLVGMNVVRHVPP
jgi:hypothetical protein